jgi:hypothetical protein
MNLTLRPGTSADAERYGTICYEAFKAIADRDHFPKATGAVPHGRSCAGRIVQRPPLRRTALDPSRGGEKERG